MTESSKLFSLSLSLPNRSCRGRVVYTIITQPSLPQLPTFDQSVYCSNKKETTVPKKIFRMDRVEGTGKRSFTSISRGLSYSSEHSNKHPLNFWNRDSTRESHDSSGESYDSSGESYDSSRVLHLSGTVSCNMFCYQNGSSKRLLHSSALEANW